MTGAVQSPPAGSNFEARPKVQAGLEEAYTQSLNLMGLLQALGQLDSDGVCHEGQTAIINVSQKLADNLTCHLSDLDDAVTFSRPAVVPLDATQEVNKHET